ncbi:MAG: PD40 domain-containing protein [Thermomicrobiales bacterium]|nr:PD40 domain-containing protein [Thermomicrobiales bacterium]
MTIGDTKLDDSTVEPVETDSEEITAQADDTELVADEDAPSEDGAEAAATAEDDAALANLPPVDPEPDRAAPLEDQLLPGAVSIDPTGVRAAFLQNDSAGVPWLWLLNLEDGEAAPAPLENADRPYTFVEDEGGPQWSPDGQFLAMTARYTGADSTHIRIVDAQTGATALLVRHPGADSWPRWSPDGEWIAFVSVRDGQQFIAVAGAQGDGPATQLTNPPLGHFDREPTWDVKLDGGRIAFLRNASTPEGQAGDHIWTVALANSEEKQQSKKLVHRRSLRWGTTRPLILHVAEETDWHHIAVVNVDNQAAWTISSEQGDKSDPQWSFDGNRVLFVRSKNGVVSVCERATSAATSEALEPGPGRAWSPRWVPGPDDQKRVFYAFSPANGAPAFYIQANKKDAERDSAPLPGGWSASGRRLIAPTNLDFTLLKNVKTSGLFFRRAEGAGPAPAVILLGGRPDLAPNAGFDPAAQALAAAGLAVYAPLLPGMHGSGRKVSAARKDRADIESEVDDLLAVIDLLKENNGVDSSRIAIVGEGYGGALALVLAGSRPGTVQGVVAIDPVVDWDSALDEAEGAERAWYRENYGLPIAQMGRYALRTPMTFAGVIDAPALLIERTPGEIHVPLLRSKLDELDRPYWFEQAAGESGWAVYARAATFLANAFRGQLEAPVVEEPAAEPIVLSPEELAAMIETPVAAVESIEVAEEIEAEAAFETDELETATEEIVEFEEFLEPEGAPEAEEPGEARIAPSPPIRADEI